MQLISSFEPRVYQQVIATQCVNQNSLIVLPTGLGKTAIAILIMLHHMQKYPDKKILFLAPTRPLVHQHKSSFESMVEGVNEEDIVVFTGNVSPEKRAALFQNAKIIFSTPQGLENDVLTSRIATDELSLVIFDEAHRATGEYSYVWIAKQVQKTHAHIIGMTASPGTDIETVTEIVQNLHIEHIEVRSSESPDVKAYVQQTKIVYQDVTLPDSFVEIQTQLQKAYLQRIKQLQQFGYFKQKRPDYIGKGDLLKFTASCQAQIAKHNTTPEVFQCLTLSAQAIKINHAIELLETQGIPSLYIYLSELFNGNSTTKAAASLKEDPNIRLSYTKTKVLQLEQTSHPKIPKLLSILRSVFSQNNDAKVIIFSQYRDTLQNIISHLEKCTYIRPELFLGQAKKKGIGMSQKQQLQTIEDFKSGVHNVLCMSSVGEEGLDIPAVDAVIFYEPIPSAIRSIQRKGRTGRLEKGAVHVLCALGTRDVANKYIALRKEKKMYEILDSVKKTMSSPKEPTLASFHTPTIAKKEVIIQKLTHAYKIIIDAREKQSTLTRLLHETVDIELKQLDVGDFVVSQDVVVELKRVSDFVDSIVDGRILQQIKQLKSAVLKPLIIVQGEENLFSQRNIHPNAIYGMLSTITISYNIPILFTRNDEDTANLLFMIVRKEQGEKKLADITLHAAKPKSQKEQIEYIVSSFPEVGISIAKRLLTHFHTVYAICNASVTELSAVEGVGEKKAQLLHDMFRKKYE